VVIYAGVNGYLDRSVNRVRASRRLLSLVRTKNGDILEDVRKTNDLTDATAGKLKGVVDGTPTLRVMLSAEQEVRTCFSQGQCWSASPPPRRRRRYQGMQMVAASKLRRAQVARKPHGLMPSAWRRCWPTSRCR